MPKQQIPYVAFHEAGHAVANLAVEQDFIEVVMHDEPSPRAVAVTCAGAKCDTAMTRVPTRLVS